MKLGKWRKGRRDIAVVVVLEKKEKKGDKQKNDDIQFNNKIPFLKYIFSCLTTFLL